MCQDYKISSFFHIATETNKCIYIELGPAHLISYKACVETCHGDSTSPVSWCYIDKI